MNQLMVRGELKDFQPHHNQKVSNWMKENAFYSSKCKSRMLFYALKIEDILLARILDWILPASQ